MSFENLAHSGASSEKCTNIMTLILVLLGSYRLALMNSTRENGSGESGDIGIRTGF